MESDVSHRQCDGDGDGNAISGPETPHPSTAARSSHQLFTKFNLCCEIHRRSLLHIGHIEPFQEVGEVVAVVQAPVIV